MSRSDTVFVILALVMVFVFLPPAGEFFFALLRHLSAAGLSALAALAILLLFRHLNR